MLSQRKGEKEKETQRSRNFRREKPHQCYSFLLHHHPCMNCLEESYVPTCQTSKIAANVPETNLILTKNGTQEVK